MNQEIGRVMKVIWSDFASTILVEIFQYYVEKAGKNIATKIKSRIFNSTKQLIKHPDSGQFEKSLERLGEGHRYIVSGNYKVIYKKIKEGILITDVFDTRQNPQKINDTGRKLRN